MKRMWKRLVSLVLAAALLCTMLPTAALAAVGATVGNTAAENQAILEQLEAITGSQEDARALYARLDALGVLDGGDWVTESLVIDGEEYTLEEASALAQTLPDGQVVQVGETAITAADLKTMLEIESEIARIRETYFDGQDWTPEQLASIQSFQQALDSGDFVVTSQADEAMVGPSGADHGLRVSVKETSRDDANKTVTFIAALNREAAQDVTFSYQAHSGSAKATDGGTVTISAGAKEQTFTVNFAEGDLYEGRDGNTYYQGSLGFYVALCGITNALFDNGLTAMGLEVEGPEKDSPLLKGELVTEDLTFEAFPANGRLYSPDLNSIEGIHLAWDWGTGAMAETHRAIASSGLFSVDFKEYREITKYNGNTTADGVNTGDLKSSGALFSADESLGYLFSTTPPTGIHSGAYFGNSYNYNYKQIELRISDMIPEFDYFEEIIDKNNENAIFNNKIYGIDIYEVDGGYNRWQDYIVSDGEVFESVFNDTIANFDTTAEQAVAQNPNLQNWERYYCGYKDTLEEEVYISKEVYVGAWIGRKIDPLSPFSGLTDWKRIEIYSPTSSSEPDISGYITTFGWEDRTGPTVEGVALPAGTFHYGQSVPVAVTFSEPVKAEGARLTANGQTCAPLEGSGTISHMLTFLYPVQSEREGAQLTLKVENITGVEDHAGNKLAEGYTDTIQGNESNTNLAGHTVGDAISALKVEPASVSAIGGQVKVTASVRLGYEDVFTSLSNKLYASTDGGKTLHAMTATDEDGRAYACTLDIPPNSGEKPLTSQVELYAGKEEDSPQLIFGPLAAFTQDAAKYITKNDLSITQTNFPKEGTTLYPESLTEDNTPQVAINLSGTGFTFGDMSKAAGNFAWSVEVKSTEDGNDVWTPDITGQVASLRVDEDNKGTIALASKSGTFRVALTAYNGGPDEGDKIVGGEDVTVHSAEITTGIGSNPMLLIAPSLQRISIRSGSDAVVRWTSNLTEKQYEVLTAQGMSEEEALEEPFTFTVQAYEHKNKGYEYSTITTPDFTNTDEWTPLGKAIEVESTQADTVSQCAVPGMTEPSVAGKYGYGIQVTASFKDALGTKHSFDEFALVSVASQPAVVELDEPQLYYIEGQKAELSWTVRNFDTINNADFQLVITNNDTGETVFTGRKELLEKGDDALTGRYTLDFGTLSEGAWRNTYTVELRARNTPESTWSYDSAVLYCYDANAFQLYVDDKPADDTLIMDNVERLHLEDYTSNEDLRNAILDRDRDIALTDSVTLNPNVPWGNVSDQVVWKNTDPDFATLNYRQGTLYEDIRLFDYESYNPGSDFMISGLQTGTTTLTAAHKLAQGVLKDELTVDVRTLRDKLYLIQLNPAAGKDDTTILEYTNGDGEEKKVYANASGAAVIYEPSGVKSDVRCRSFIGEEDEKKTYVGTLYAGTMLSGEADSTKLELYPLNTLKLREVATAELYVKDEKGDPYANKELTINAGVYKNGEYCPHARFDVNSEFDNPVPGDKNGFTAKTDENGKLTIYMNVEQFYTASEEQGTPLEASDQLTFRFLLQTKGDGYYPQLLERNGMMSQSETVRFGEKVVNLEPNAEKKRHAFAIQQQAALGDVAVADLKGFTGKVGPGPSYQEVTVSATILWWGDETGTEAAYYDSVGAKAPNQTFRDIAGYEFTDLRFSQLDMRLDFDAMRGWLPSMSSRSLELRYFDGSGTLLRTTPQSFRAVNMVDATPPDQDPDAKDAMNALTKSLVEQMMSRLGGDEGFGSAVGDALLSTGLNLIAGSGLSAGGKINLNLFATSDPTVFRGLFAVGYGDANNRITMKEGLDVAYMELLSNVVSGSSRAKTLSNLTKAVEMLAHGGGSMGGLETYKEFGGYIESEIFYEDDQWHIHVLNGGFNAGFGVEYVWRFNSLLGVIPVTAEFAAGGSAAVELQVGVDRLNDLNYYLTELRLAAYLRAFGGFGFDFSIIALKIGLFGTVDLAFTARWFNEEGDKTIYGDQSAQKLELDGRTGIEFYAKFLFFTYRTVLASIPLVEKTWYFSDRDDWNSIEQDWANVGQGISEDTDGVLGARTANTLYYDSRSGQTLYASPVTVTMEDRDYLEDFDRVWNPGSGVRLLAARNGGDGDGMTPTLTNAYPAAAPLLTEDGKLMVYLDDGKSKDVTETRAAFATQIGNSYSKGEPIDGGKDTGYGDSQLAVAGTGEFAAAAWVRLNANPGKDAGESMSANDQMAMLASTEVYAAIYNGSTWETAALTENGNAPDLAPAVAVSPEGKALVAWRSVAASNPEKLTRFDAGDSILYKTYQNGKWSEAKTLYNGTSGAVKGLEAAMLSDGTAALVYTIDTNDKPLAADGQQAQALSGQADKDNTGLEVVYAVVDDLADDSQREGSDESAAAANVRLTYDDQLDENPQITTAMIDENECFILGWSRSETASDADAATASHDLALRAVDEDGRLLSNLPDSVAQMAQGDGVGITSNFRFSKGAGDVSNLSILWVEPVTADDSAESQSDSNKGQMPDAERDRLMAVKLVQTGDTYGLTTPIQVAVMENHTLIDHFDACTQDGNSLRTVILGSDYGTNLYDDVKDASGDPVQVQNEDGITSQLQVAKSVSNLYTVSSTYGNAVSIDRAAFEAASVMAGFSLPVQLTVTNRGIAPITGLTVTFDGKEASSSVPLPLAPGQSLPVTVFYQVPSTADDIKDVECTVTATFGTDGTAKDTEPLALSTPDAGISRLELISQEDGERVLQATLYNDGEVPLDAAKHTVKLALYSDSAGEHQLTTPVTLADTAELSMVNDGGYTTQLTFNVGEYVEKTLKEEEIPEGGLQVYAKVWIEEKPQSRADGETTVVEDTQLGNDVRALTLTSLLEQQGGAPATVTHLLDNSGGNTQVTVTVQNNSLSETTTGNLIATLLDKNGNVLEQRQSYKAGVAGDGFITLNGEEKTTTSIAFSQKGDRVELTYSNAVIENEDNTNLNTLKLEGVELTYDPDSKTYTGACASLSQALLTVVPEDARATVAVNGEETSPAVNLPLSSGQNTVTITVTAADGSTTAAYTLNVYNDVPAPPVNPGGDSRPIYPPVIPDAAHGSVSASPTRPHQGDTVTITTKPDEGYRVGSVAVVDQNGKPVAVQDAGGGAYTFTQPGGKVTIRVTFVPEGWPFVDVAEKDWFYNAVKYVYENDIMVGTSATTFEPNLKLTRAQAVQMLYNINGQLEVTGDSGFTDVSGWYEKAVTWASQNDVVAGYEDNTYRPNRTVTREEFAQMMYNYAKFKGYDTSAQADLSQYPDGAKTSAWAETALSWANAHGLINGHADTGTIDPKGTTTRAQAASILMNFDLKLVNAE